MKKLSDRMYNVEKGRKRDADDSLEATPKKRGRPKRVVTLECRYPSIRPLEGEDATQQQQRIQAISKEMEKEKPRKDILLPLMKSTFYARRQYILDNDGSVFCKVQKFPALKMPPLVCCVHEEFRNVYNIKRGQDLHSWT